ncbi:ATP-binding protein [bacterium]|nr:ATP-binding protein [bacterium]
MIQREMTKVMKARAKEYPVLTVVGPRQSGKTTLVRSCFPNYNYANLEDPETRDLAESDYKRFLSAYKTPLIIDEIQRVPKLASAIQVKVDENRSKTGQYILTGSHQPVLKQTVTQSLAGRSAFLELLPLTFSELYKGVSKKDVDVDDLILTGTMPELTNGRIKPSVYYKNYVNSYIERDVRLISNIENTSSFNRFLVLLAGRIGQLVNLNTLSGEVGVSHTTLNSWLNILEASFIVFRLEPYYANIGKRLIKTPKIYFTETGLAAYLLGIKNSEQVSSHPLRGNLFENLVAGDILRHEKNADNDGDLFFFRTTNGLEIDLLRLYNDSFQPIEIKSSMTYNPSLENSLERFMDIFPKVVKPTLIYAGKNIPPGDKKIEWRNYLDFKL